MDTPLISVIVPVYNSEKYLERCFDSIFNQTYKNFELIIVNDGSSDDSQSIIDKYASKDSRIIKILQKNSGGAAARNRAIEIAKGDFIYFIDSDDYLESRALEIMVKTLNGYNCDCCVINFSTSKTPDYDKNYTVEILDNHELMKELFLDKKITSQPWRKLYPRKVFTKYKFPETKKVVHDMGADHYFLSLVNKAAYISAPLYVYTDINPTNLSNSNGKAILSSLNRAKVLIDRLEFADNNYPDLSYLLLPQITNFLMSSYMKIINSKNDDENKKYVLDKISYLYPRLVNCENVPLSHKVVLFSIKHDFILLINLAKIYYFKNIYNN